MNTKNAGNPSQIPGLTKTRVLTECAMMVALATVLSLLKIAEMPAGGSVTAAAMLPLVLIAHRHGTKVGLGSAVVFAVMQAILGMKNFSYVAGWQSILAVLFLDYLSAYTVVGLAGIFKRIKNPAVALSVGTVFVSALRYLCAVVSGAVIWAECAVTLPDAAAWSYSFAYNAAYMVPETLVTAIAAFYLGSVLDFSGVNVHPIRKRNGYVQLSKQKKNSRLPYLAIGTLIAIVALIFDVVVFFMNVQTEDGFSFAALRYAPFWTVGIVSAVGLFAWIAGYLLEKAKKRVKK